MKKYLKLKPHKHKSPDYRPSAIANKKYSANSNKPHAKVQKKDSKI